MSEGVGGWTSSYRSDSDSVEDDWCNWGGEKQCFITCFSQTSVCTYKSHTALQPWRPSLSPSPSWESQISRNHESSQILKFWKSSISEHDDIVDGFGYITYLIWAWTMIWTMPGKFAESLSVSCRHCVRCKNTTLEGKKVCSAFLLYGWVCVWGGGEMWAQGSLTWIQVIIWNTGGWGKWGRSTVCVWKRGVVLNGWREASYCTPEEGGWRWVRLRRGTWPKDAKKTRKDAPVE
jgi:hypothetical protein